MPTKNNEETNEEFIDRCMIDNTMVSEYEDQDQRLAICINQLEDYRALEDINTKPTKEMAEEAEQGLEWRREYGRGGTSVGVSRARDISNRADLSIETIKRMNSYFARHEVDKEAEGFRVGEKGYPSAGRIAWALWGGDPGQSWTKRKIEEIKKEEERDISERIEKALQKKVKDHNEDVKDLKVDWNANVTLKTLIEVFERGVGAFHTNPQSVRPNMTPERWGLARVNNFLKALKDGKFSGGKHDTDLLPNNHPVVLDMKEENQNIMENEERAKVGSMITDGIELPLFDTIDEAEAMAEELGGSGHHIHTMDGEEFYMPFSSHEEIMEVMGDNEEMDESEQKMGHEDEEEEGERPKEGYYRNISNAEQRLLNSNIELRQEGESATIVGYGAVFNSRSENLGGFYEYIDRNAFDNVLKNETDTRFLINHEGIPLGRTTAGTLRLSVDEVGLRYEVDLPNTQTANELKEALKRGDVNQSSFAFSVERDKWSEEDGAMRRDILSIDRLLDVSAVSFPAYPSATVGIRSMNKYKAEKEKLQYKNEEKDLHFRSIRELKIKLLKSISK